MFGGPKLENEIHQGNVHDSLNHLYIYIFDFIHTQFSKHWNNSLHWYIFKRVFSWMSNHQFITKRGLDQPFIERNPCTNIEHSFSSWSNSNYSLNRPLIKTLKHKTTHERINAPFQIFQWYTYWWCFHPLNGIWRSISIPYKSDDAVASRKTSSQRPGFLPSTVWTLKTDPPKSSCSHHKDCYTFQQDLYMFIGDPKLNRSFATTGKGCLNPKYSMFNVPPPEIGV